MATDNTTYVVSSCNEYYFPLLKGLYLSLLDSGALPLNVRLAFLNMGCSEMSLAWLRGNGIEVREMTRTVMGELADERFGYRRAQICRPFLPIIFPEAYTLAWMDCDMWAQDVAGLCRIFEEATSAPHHVFVSVETHPEYGNNDFNLKARADEMYSYYAPIYGCEVALNLCQRPTFNSGLFAIARDNPIWSQWQQEVVRIYLNNYYLYSDEIIHFAEQISLNMLLRRLGSARIFDPLYNFIALWNPPFRDEAGVVRLRMPPHVPVGVLHLAGGWKHFSRTYTENRLLYREGAYLTGSDRKCLYAQQEVDLFR